MGRPEAPLPNELPGPARELAQALRHLRDSQRLSYRELSERAHSSPSSLSRALSGRTLPTWRTVEAFLHACDVPKADIAPWKARWDKAAEATELRASTPSPREAEVLNLMLSGRLKDLHIAAGRPTLRVISNRSGIPISTVHRVLSPRPKYGMPSADVALKVADCLLGFLRTNGPTRQFEDVDALVHSHRDEEGQLRPPLREGAVRRAVAAAAVAEESAATALREFAARASRLEQRIASGELHADDEVVRLLTDLRAQAEAAR